MMRCFLAINLPPQLRARIFRETEPWRAVAPDVAWVREELLHFTLKFLGEVGADQIAALRTATGTAVAAHEPMTMHLAGAGVFPNFLRPRVVWIGVKSHGSVIALADDVERACEPLGFERDARGFSPHLTLGRVKRELPSPVLESLERTLRAANNEYELAVAAVDLMRSDLGPGGPRYSVLASLPLRKALTPVDETLRLLSP
jgi:2'-5' RNA ligase